MSGSSNLSGDESIIFTDNLSFDGTERGGKMTTDGQLFIGHTASTRANNGGHVVLGSITSPGGTITVGFADPNITLDVAGGSMAVDSFGLQSGISPVVPDGTGLVTFQGTTVAAGGTPVATFGSAANTMQLRVQFASAIGATDATQVGLAAFNSGDFTVDANGFVSASGTGVGQTITGDSGGALSPTAGNWNILGRSGSKTSGSGSTLTVNSPPFADVGVGGTVTLNSGSFATAAITLTTPATAGLADGDLVQFVATNGVLVVQMNTGQVGHLGSSATSSGGTFTGSATGDSLSLRWQASTSDWWATSSIGVWVLA